MMQKTIFEKSMKVIRDNGWRAFFRFSSHKLRHTIFETSIKVIRENGWRTFFRFSFHKLRSTILPIFREKTVKDILFVNGCRIEHPSRYRVDHQLEQLEFNGMSCDQIFFKYLEEEHLFRYRGFIFFRCIHTPFIEKFIEQGRYYNKTFFYDIDDLMFDEEEVGKIEYVKKLEGDNRKSYYFGVRNTLKLIQLCDYGITTTETLSSEMEKHLEEVFINPNVASESMLKIFTRPLQTMNKKETKDIYISYGSGSITHDPDLEMISGALKSVMEKYEHVMLVLYGLISVPDNLKFLSDRIIIKPFTSWEKYYEDIKLIDINLAPLKNTKFNNAKSENKWTEAAIAHKVTIASNVGAFKDVITHNETGILADNNTHDWSEKLFYLVENKFIREQIAQNAYYKALETHTTVNTGRNLFLWIKNKLKPSIGFVLPNKNISGGALVIFKHACFLQYAGYDVYLVSMDYDANEVKTKYGNLKIVSSNCCQYSISFDKLVATLFTSVDFVLSYLKVDERYYLVQNYEVDFNSYGDIKRQVANNTYNVRKGLKYRTISRWCQDWLQKKYDQAAIYAPNGIDLDLFPFKKRDWDKRKITILIEGNCKDNYKNVDESFKIIELLDRRAYDVVYLSNKQHKKDWYTPDRCYFNIPHEKISKIYQQAHILLKSSLVESFSYPPLEMMSTGGAVVVAKNGGNQEYVRHGYNALVYNPGNLKQASDYIEELVSSEELRQVLIEGGLETAKNRSWEKFIDQIVELYA